MSLHLPSDFKVRDNVFKIVSSVGHCFATSAQIASASSFLPTRSKVSAFNACEKQDEDFLIHKNDSVDYKTTHLRELVVNQPSSSAHCHTTWALACNYVHPKHHRLVLVFSPLRWKDLILPSTKSVKDNVDNSQPATHFTLRHEVLNSSTLKSSTNTHSVVATCCIYNIYGFGISKLGVVSVFFLVSSFKELCHFFGILFQDIVICLILGVKFNVKIIFCGC